MKEIWKPVIIDGIKPFYSVSNQGRFRNNITGKLLHPSFDRGGYLTIGFAAYSKKGKKKQKRFLAHRVVALTFIPNPNPTINTTVNHIDGNKENNNVSNLEWMSNSENIRDMYRHGRHPTKHGVEVPNNRYTEKQIHDVCKLLSDGASNKDISIKTGVPTNIIGFIKRRTLWTHISSLYEFDKPKNKVRYGEYFDKFDRHVMEGLSWAEVKNKYHITGSETKSLRELYMRRKMKYKLVL